MERLRDPEEGCPWDLRQDFRSIVPSTLEECYELAHAIEQEDFAHVAEELGDVLFQVIFYAQLGRERGLFTFDSVVGTLVAKLVRRHPHVFAEGEIEGRVEASAGIDEVKESWEAIKRSEREAKRQTGTLADVPLALPALPRAQKIQKRASAVEFDWADTEGVLDKLQEEIDELRAAYAEGSAAAIREEMGDVLFTCVNVARSSGLDSEATLRAATTKFEARFNRMETLAREAGSPLGQISAERLDELWRQSKALEQLSGEGL
jgi:ATP diphosphatase